ncbi:MAG: type IV pilus secretin PilQ [Legionellaceae bacterium]|nr:type IV pilus secretin PilQ [Legionellaceae bacterium]
MMDINLLPWRAALRLRQSKRFILYLMLCLLSAALIIFYLEYQARQRVAQQVLRNQQLTYDIKRLKASFHKQLHTERKQRMKQNLVLRHGVIVPDLVPLQTDLIQINYAKATDLALLVKDKSNLLLSDRGILTADPRTNVIWLQDTAENMQKIKALLKQLDVPNRQVLIEARLVNMSKDCAEDLGVRFGLLRAVQPIDGLSNPVNPSQPDAQPADHLNIDLGALPLDATPASIGIALAMLGQHVLLDLELSALESEGRAEIIASPQLITTNHEVAIIESGEDIPYQEYTASGATSVSFKKAVLSLKVIPQITSNGKLMMALSINQDSDSGRRVQGVPIILTKSIETNVLVNNGQTIVLGGIYKQDKNNSIARVPFLGTLPIVGHLFRRKQIRMRDEELLIFITPKILTVK